MKPAPDAALAALDAQIKRLRDERYAATEAHIRAMELISARIDTLEEVRNLAGAPTSAAAEKAPRAKRGDVQAEILRVVERQHRPTAEDIAANLGRKPSQINAALTSMLKAGKVAMDATGGYGAPTEKSEAAE